MKSWAWAALLASIPWPHSLPYSVANIVEDGAPKKNRFLWDQRNLPVPTLNGHMAEVFAVDRDVTFRRIVEAVKQIDHGGLAGTGRSYERDQFAWFGFERHIR